MDLVEALRTTGAARDFTDRSVDDAMVAAVLDDARFAPSGGNRQPWRVAVVKDPVLRRHLAELMTAVWQEYLGESIDPTRTPFAFGLSSGHRRVEAPNPLLDKIEQVPVVLALAADLNKIALMDGGLGRPPITGGASMYPFAWSILLAARARGLGGVMTTFLSRAEAAAATGLGLPDGHALAATIFLGYPAHQNTRLRRTEVDAFATVDRFDGEPLT
ncbi:MAG: nitroreductase family protein [Ilumatobacteraceae bacterium]